MQYCPNCQQTLAENEAICPNCGFNAEDKTQLIKPTDNTEEEPIKVPKKPFHKRPIFWVLLTTIILALLTAGGIVFGYYYSNYKASRDYKSAVKTIWMDTTAQSKSLDNIIDSVASETDLPMLANELSDMENSLAEAQAKAVNLEPPKKYAQQNKDFLLALDKYSTYIIQAKILANKEPVNMEYSKLTDLRIAGEDAKVATDNFVTETDFIDRKLPEGIFKMNNLFKPIISLAKAKSAKEKQKRQKALAESQKRAAQQTVTSFMQARIHKDIAEMRRYFTEAAEKVFDPDLEFQGDFDPIDFKIIKTETHNKGYRITGAETDRSWEGDKFSNKWEFIVIQEGGSWLIDHRKFLQ